MTRSSDDWGLAMHVAEVLGAAATAAFRRRTERRLLPNGSVSIPLDVGLAKLAESVILSQRWNAWVITEDTYHVGARHRKDVWLIDPLDGTWLFSAGMTGWAHLITKLDNSEVKFALAYDPLAGMHQWGMYYGERGKVIGPFGELCVRKTPRKIEDATVAVAGMEDGVTVEHHHVMQNAKAVVPITSWRGIMAVAQGEVDAFVGVRQSAWDFMGMDFLLKEAEGYSWWSDTINIYKEKDWMVTYVAAGTKQLLHDLVVLISGM